MRGGARGWYDGWPLSGGGPPLTLPLRGCPSPELQERDVGRFAPAGSTRWEVAATREDIAPHIPDFRPGQAPAILPQVLYVGSAYIQTHKDQL